MSGPSFSGQPTSGWLRWDALRAPAFFPKQAVATWSDRILSGAVRQLDATLRRRQGIIEFTRDPECLFRLSAHRAESDIRLRDQTVERGEEIGEIHFWNEHILPMTRGGANMVWGAAMRRRLRHSLVCMARFVESDPRFSEMAVFRGEVAFGPGKEIDRTRCFTEGFGFEITVRPQSSGLNYRLTALGQAIFLWGMRRTFNRASLQSIRRLTHPTWLQLWMTRETLSERYGARTAALR